MTSPPLIWPARLHHFRLNSPDPDRLADFYRRALGLDGRSVGEDLHHLAGPARAILLGPGPAATVPFIAFRLDDAARRDALRRRLRELAIEIEQSPSPLFAEDSFAVRDPDGLCLVFGVAEDDPAPGQGLPGRLQHIVFASSQPDELQTFYRDRLGFVESDRVVDQAGALTALFLRSDEEHHSYAAFRATAAGFDHFALETGGWTEIRDWADHFAGMRLPIWWGPGRHGPGNNLFFMVRDPDGNRIEISAELERMPHDQSYRIWPHEERTLNLWGQSWMRS